MLHAAYAPLAAAGFRYLASHQDDEITLRRLKQGIAFVAEWNGVIVGTATLMPPQPASLCEWYRRPDVWAFGQFAVQPDLQRHGIGRRLLHTAEQRAAIEGAMELALDTAENATHLVRAYKQRGFRFIQYVSWPETNYRSVVLSKRLPNVPVVLP